jgi:hypothetical protein
MKKARNLKYLAFVGFFRRVQEFYCFFLARIITQFCPFSHCWTTQTKDLHSIGVSFFGFDIRLAHFALPWAQGSAHRRK